MVFPNDLQEICDQVDYGLEVRGDVIGRDVGNRYSIEISGFDPDADIRVYEHPLEDARGVKELRYEFGGGIDAPELHEVVKTWVERLSAH